jgi:atypical dual specificity phosphatase
VRVALVAALVTACGEDQLMPYDESDEGSPDGSLELSTDNPFEPVAGFSWVIDHGLAGMQRPGADGDLEGDLQFLEAERLALLVSLTEEALPKTRVEARGMATLHLPIRDYTPPTLAQQQELVAVVRPYLRAGRSVGVHCEGGHGRTGTMLATYYVSMGLSAEYSIEYIRAQRPGSIETPEQEQAVRDYEASLRR